jgi:hypothetical protein
VGPNVFVLKLGANSYVLECGSAEEKVYWMDIVRKRAGFRPTSQLVAPK